MQARSWAYYGLAAFTIVLAPPHSLSAQQSVTSFTLVNADTDLDIGPLLEGDTLNYATLATLNVNVRANTSPNPVGSVRFSYDGNGTYRTESVAPYALAGDNSGDYFAWTPALGAHEIIATPWTGSGATGTAGTPLSVNFHVVDDGGGPPPACDPVTNTWDVSGDLQQWHAVSISFDGYCSDESATPNPFTDYRLQVTFTHSGSGASYVVPGFFAADGNAAESGARLGTIWRVYFAPSHTGVWNYSASFRQGSGIAIDSNPSAGSPVGFDGASGSFSINPSDKAGRDHRGKGFLRHPMGHYLQFDNGDYFLKGGADSPENFLAYADFDSTYNSGGTSYIKSYAAHVADWQSGDPSWHGSKGKGIIGALNYLASEGMNSVYFLTMNVNGDGKDVWPWTDHLERYRYDVSKLDQWEIVFSHMDRQGIMLHVLTQETENDQLLDGGALGPERRLYYRELIARFGHHLAITWNLGEENTNTDAERKAFVDYVHDIDPYDHPIVLHTYPGSKNAVYTPLLGYPNFDGASLQTGNMTNTHAETREWLDKSAGAGLPWFVSLDEIGPANVGVTPDGTGNNHDAVRHHALWGNLMAGGAGVEWYFGYSFPNSDLTAEDWRSRDQMWDYTRFALEFFQNHLPFWEMAGDDTLSLAADDYVLAKPGESYAIYLPSGGTTNLTLPSGPYDVRWYNPREGGGLQVGSVSMVSGGGSPSIGQPPSDPTLDWVALVTKQTVSIVNHYAVSEQLNDGSQSGDYVDTHVDDNTFEILTETETGGKPTSRTSLLDHRWTFNLSSGESTLFYVSAYRGDNSDGDDFRFEYSTDGTDFAPLVTVNTTVESDYQVPLPSGPSGVVYVRVVDTNRSRGARSKDKLYVDHMYFKTIDGTAVPVAEFSALPVSGGAPLVVQFTDLSAHLPTSWLWDFGDGESSTAQHPSHVYTSIGTFGVTLVSTNADGSDSETKSGYIAVSSLPVIHVADISVARTGSKWVRGTAIATIHDSNGTPVPNVTVTGVFSAPNSAAFSDVTDAGGTASFRSDRTKTPPGNWCFEVTDVAMSGSVYAPAENVFTVRCEDGSGSAPEFASKVLGDPVLGLLENHPNPFNPLTVVSFSLDRARDVRLEVFDQMGRRVAILVQGMMEAGQHAIPWDASSYATGTYLYRLIAEDFMASETMVLVN